jgi:CO/xanthine dehydrogenase FAD-binding subunit
MNTHILAQEFEYLEPKTIEEALLQLITYGDKAKVIAGGTDLIVRMKRGMVHPEVLISIARIPALHYLNCDKGLRIGALTPFQELEKSILIREKYTALFEAARSVSRTQIKKMGTVGGNLCNASPAADSAPPLMVLGGKVKLVGRDAERVVLLEEFYAGLGKTVLSSTELLAEVQLPEVKEGTGSAFLKVARVAADPAKLNVAVAIERENDVCRDCRIALGSVAPKPFRTLDAEVILKGKTLTGDLIVRASQRASEEIEPITDIRSTIEYRRDVAKVIVRDAIKLAWERAAK